MTRTRFTLCVLLSWLACQALAHAADLDHPFEISARDSSYDVGTGTWVFSGEVQIRYGTLEAAGDEAVVHQRDGEPSAMELRGSPATWRERLADGREVHGEGESIRFDPERDLLVISGASRVHHPRGIFSGDRLVYDIVNQTLSGESEEGGRVRMVIRPPDPEEE